MKKFVFTAVACVSLLFAGCSSESNSDKAREAVKNFEECMYKREYDKAKEYCSEDAKKLVDLAQSFNSVPGIDSLMKNENKEEYTFQALEDSVGKEAGWVKYINAEGDTTVSQVILKDGKWLVDNKK
ncbi:hypothetical protein HQ45_05565 [Porphyromonas crevioricanis]|uniref:DUF4878 domain-containing protein n=2 Tax=Porphyromonas crevioricanis TaxID=393921 RepID=A0A0A2FZF6_9PORP|nr:hypothetical protein [Porphyromonas crevioricanis]KGN90256.1 hypothetical protein HQ45_05565 [Porphyromonas crevioricanis]KGN96356.1 hypothetical protein HQ38_01830 [Porphyromonas crevioricanis]SJZ95668.1 hypothetical protein SAMN02745203_01390 [Porphyromonas crevioricanis]SQH72688.1 Uncharacterised protein [Porphyromonas crevioricanis]GAD04875.1 hypothetical protein PORCRE_572 [Porphyromonas crevioricanis JCM 15906]